MKFELSQLPLILCVSNIIQDYLSRLNNRITSKFVTAIDEFENLSCFLKYTYLLPIFNSNHLMRYSGIAFLNPWRLSANDFFIVHTSK